MAAMTRTLQPPRHSSQLPVWTAPAFNSERAPTLGGPPKTATAPRLQSLFVLTRSEHQHCIASGRHVCAQTEREREGGGGRERGRERERGGGGKKRAERERERERERE